ncbi:hypothetical protein HHK36_006898 [Tetracentron sinense]|uniref:F-box domain-containing protein n=1 Tax=Tetracentron sinense TaxID=13715 RepID=A0A835DPM6_TETSI|nr:hypothetical protein HHK36_006898 [Tetracentron sinense]
METMLRHSSDIISNLPEQVIETILVHLPIGDAVRTSLLSKKWRYKWTFIPDLVFDESNFCSSTMDTNLHTYKIANFVDRVLLQHKGSIHKCILKLPPMFKGFNNLKSLNLVAVTLSIESTNMLGKEKFPIWLGFLVLTGLEKLVISSYFMERLPVTYDCLKSISLPINFSDLNQNLGMLFLFQSSPNLQELKMVDLLVKQYQTQSVNTERAPKLSHFSSPESIYLLHRRHQDPPIVGDLLCSLRSAIWFPISFSDLQHNLRQLHRIQSTPISFTSANDSASGQLPSLPSPSGLISFAPSPMNPTRNIPALIISSGSTPENPCKSGYLSFLLDPEF